MSFLGFVSQQSAEIDGQRVPWSVVWTLITGGIAAILAGVFRFAWKGALADVERRLDRLETELAYSQRRYHEIERTDGGGRRRRPVVDDGGDG